MAAVSISQDAIRCVRQCLRSHERDVARDLSDLRDVIQDGCASDSDKDEYAILCQVQIILASFESDLSRIQNGGAE